MKKGNEKEGKKKNIGERSRFIALPCARRHGGIQIVAGNDREVLIAPRQLNCPLCDASQIL